MVAVGRNRDCRRYGIEALRGVVLTYVLGGEKWVAIPIEDLQPDRFFVSLLLVAVPDHHETRLVGLEAEWQ